MKELEKFQQEVKEIRENEEVLNQQLETAEKKLRQELAKNDVMSEVTRGLQSLHEKMKVGFQPIESTLSCLSCLEYLSEPNQLTLVCGHSICNKVSPGLKQMSVVAKILCLSIFSASHSIVIQTVKILLSSVRSARLKQRTSSYATVKL